MSRNSLIYYATSFNLSSICIILPWKVEKKVEKTIKFIELQRNLFSLFIVLIAVESKFNLFA